MILYVYVVTASGHNNTDGNIAVTGSAKKALDKAAEYVAASVPADEPEPVVVLDKAKMADFKKQLKTTLVTVSHARTEKTATVKKFNLE